MVSIGILGFFFLLGLDKALDAAPAAWVAPFTLVTPIWTVAIDVALRGQPLMPARDTTLVRLVTSFATTAAEVDRFVATTHTS